MSGNVTYVVRGAVMRCSKGSSPICINLPASHGSYAKGKPIMIKTDNAVGANIGSFGVCKCTMIPCCPAFLGDWMFCKEDTLIKGIPALLKTSMLICAKGGAITFETDGQA